MPLLETIEGASTGRGGALWSAVWLGAVGALFVLSVVLNWGRWGGEGLCNADVLREVVTPLRLLQGQVLYRDFNFLYGPLPPYLNAFYLSHSPLTTVDTVQVIGLCLGLLSFLLILWLGRTLRLRELVGPALLCGVAWYATLPYMLSPPSFNGRYAAVLATAGVIAAVAAAQSDAPLGWVGMGVCGMLAALSKPEGAFTVGLGALAAVAVIGWRKGWRTLALRIALCGIPALLVGGALVGYWLDLGMGWANLVEGLLQRRFQAELARGFIGQYNYFFGIKAPITLAAGVAGTALLALFCHYWPRAKATLPAAVALGLLAAAVLFGYAHAVINDFVNLGILFGSLLGYWWVRKEVKEEARPRYYVLWAAGLAAWLRPYMHVGALTIPFARPTGSAGVFLSLLFWSRMLPDLSRRVWLRDAPSRDTARRLLLWCTAAGAVLYGGLGVWQTWQREWSRKTVVQPTPFGDVRVTADSQNHRIWSECLRYLRHRLKVGERIVAFDDSAGLEFALGFLPALPVSQVNSQVYPGDADRIIRALENRQDIRYVVVYVKPWGSWHFGVQCCRVADYIEEQWRQEKRFGVPEQLKSLALMSPERKSASGMQGCGLIVYGRWKDARHEADGDDS